LPDGGAGQFAATIREVNRLVPAATTDVLVSDLLGSADNLAAVVAARPDILAHNLETVPRLYQSCRQGADYDRSLRLLGNAKNIDPSVLTKSGIMLGLGETRAEVLAVMRDLRKAECDFLTLGQYLRPGADNIAVQEFIRPEAFAEYKLIGEEMGFSYVASAPFVRSSFHAEEALRHIRRQPTA